MSITVQHGDNAYWGLHVFLEGTDTAEEIRGAYASAPGMTIRRGRRDDVETALRIDRLIQEV
jgi:hypothetical protein